MGGCVSSSKKQKDTILLDSYDNQPDDTVTFINKPLPTLTFSAQLTKIKIKRCMYPSLSMKFSIANVEQFLLPQKDVTSQVIKWEVQHVFRFQMNQYEMRKKFLIITFLDKTNREVGFLKINLYLLATGPFHQDFALKLENDPTARLSFNLKIAQIIKMKFEFLQAQMIPYEKQYPGDKFAFSVRSIMGHNTEYTNQSYVVSIAFDDEQDQKQPQKQNKKEKEKEKEKLDSEIVLRKIKSRKSIISNLHHNEVEVDRNSIKWSKQKSLNMPSFSTEIALFDMNSSAFHIIYWKIHQQTQNNLQENVKAECFVSINKLLNFQSKIVFDDQKIPYDERIVKLQQKNWSHGKQVGLSEFKIKFSIQNHVKQMQVCVRTELGILKSSPVFSRQQTKTVNRQINELMQLSTKIDTEFIQLAKNRKNNGSSLQTRRSIDTILKYLNEQKQIMKKTVKESIMFFNYKDEAELLKGQQQLIQIAFKTRLYINQNIDEISSACFTLLFLFLKRGEFNLAHLSFNVEGASSYNIELHPFQKKKIPVAIKYQQLLSQLMSLTLSSLNFKGHESQKQFAELFCAVAYFRIPSFRKHVLQAIFRPNDPQIQEWRGTQFNLYEQDYNNNITTSEDKNTYQILFDWENNFYKFIENQEKYIKNIKQLQTILMNSEWQDRIKQRKGAFFSFVRYWCDYVESVAVNSKNLKWKHFPGYNKILHAFFVEMKNRQLNDYSDRMQKACVSLLNNQRLLNTFVAILFKKADINNPPSILKLLDYLELFFATIDKKKRMIPTTFDYNYFFKGFKMIMQSSHCYSMGKALILVYNHFNILSPDFKYAVSLYLMGKMFFRLFLHWSQNVRTIFQHLLYIRINKLTEYSTKNAKNIIFTKNQRTQLRNRYDKLMIILQNANDLKKKQEKTETLRYEKEYYKKMKKKLYMKKNNSKSIGSSLQDTQIASIRQLSYHPRKNSVMDQKLIQELARPKLERYNSEIMSKNLKIAIQEAQNKMDEIIPLTKNMTEAIDENEIFPRRKESVDFKEVKKINLLTEEQGEIWQMTKKETEYLSKSLAEYSGIHELFLKHLVKNNNSDAVPVVKLEIAYDYQDIRPEGIDEW